MLTKPDFFTLNNGFIYLEEKEIFVPRDKKKTKIRFEGDLISIEETRRVNNPEDILLDINGFKDIYKRQTKLKSRFHKDSQKTESFNSRIRVTATFSYNFKKHFFEDNKEELIPKINSLINRYGLCGVDYEARFNESIQDWVDFILYILDFQIKKYHDRLYFEKSLNELKFKLSKHQEALTLYPSTLRSFVCLSIFNKGLGICDNCSLPFISYRKDKKFCSTRCRVAKHRH